jgi:hypothetical protein
VSKETYCEEEIVRKKRPKLRDGKRKEAYIYVAYLGGPGLFILTLILFVKFILLRV